MIYIIKFDNIGLIKELQMKKEEPNPITMEIKSLSKKFKCLSKDSIRIIHQFCQYDLKRTFKVMTIVQEMKNPASVIETLIKNSQKSEEIISEFQTKYDKLYDKNFLSLQELKDEIKVKQQVKISEFMFFQFVPQDILASIMSYLDPYSFFNFAITSKRIRQLSESEAQSDYYRILCKKLFKMQPPRLPFICRFIKIREYVLNRPHEFKPNTRNAVLNNLRNYIWKMDMNSFNLEPSYFKSFGSYKNLYKNCPMVNKNGYYVLRDKYVRVGEKDQKNPVTPIHIIYYYRYLRFLEDGSVLYHVRNIKLKPEQVLTYLGKQIFEEGDQRKTMVGEYIHYKNKVFVRAVQNREVFSYELEINSTENKINNSMRVIKYTLDLIDDEQQIHQTLYATNPKNYCRNNQIGCENGPQIQGASL